MSSSHHSPSNSAEAAAIISEARAKKTPLAISGGGTRSAIGRPMQTAADITTAALNGITLYEPAEMVIGAKAGTPLGEVQKTLAEKGQQLAFEPMDHRALMSSTGEPTIGAIAAGNISGPRRINFGAARDSLIGVKFINGRGEDVQSGGRVMKNVTGLDLVKLSAGAWGTLGFLHEVTFKVLPKPETQLTLLISGLDDARAIAALSAALGSPFEPSGAAHLPRDIDRVAKTLIRLEGFSDSLRYRAGQLKELLAGYGAIDVLEADASEMLWLRVRDATFLAEPRDRAVWRLSVAPTRGPEIVAQIRRQREIRHFYDWGGGLIWIATDATGDGGASVIRAAIAAFDSGHATLVRGSQELRDSVDVFQPLPEPLMKLQKGLKASFDPDGILNPGKMYAGV
ncbi:FAD-binding protein [Terrarubrum flagellatum]|uniref:FAD-binding protein n=1 Tax=Terrirubrum flagellatum TaxID=2895980 RepID=UPI0031451148